MLSNPTDLTLVRGICSLTDEKGALNGQVARGNSLLVVMLWFKIQYTLTFKVPV